MLHIEIQLPIHYWITAGEVMRFVRSAAEAEGFHGVSVSAGNSRNSRMGALIEVYNGEGLEIEERARLSDAVRTALNVLSEYSLQFTFAE